MTSGSDPVDGGGLVHVGELVDEHQAHGELVEFDVADQLVDAWLQRWKDKPNTLDAYRRDIGKWVDFLDDMFGLVVTEARGQHVEAYQHALRTTPLPRTGEPPKPSSVDRRLGVVSSLYIWLRRREVLDRNPVEYIDRQHQEHGYSPTRRLTEDEARRFVEAAFGLVNQAKGQDVRRVADRDAMLVATLITTGLRASEICKVNVSDLGYDDGHRVVRVIRKGGKRGSVVLGAAAEMIDRRIALHGQKTGPLFVTRNGGRVDRSWVFRAVRKVAVAAAIPDPNDVTPHSLRHTFAKLAIRYGADLLDLQAALGHADPRTTELYIGSLERVDRSPVHEVGPALLKGKKNRDRAGRLF